MSKGAENGYTYTGDYSSYLVTMLKRDTQKKTALILIEHCVSGCGTLPNGVSVTVPLNRLEVN